MKKTNLWQSVIACTLFLSVALTGCKKDPITDILPVDDGTLVEISFSPTVNGEVVPWNQGQSNLKGSGLFPFTHRYSGHIIRVISGNGAWSDDIASWVMDIPLLPDGTDIYAGIKLPKGNYQVRVLAVEMPLADWVLSSPGIHSKTDANPANQNQYLAYYPDAKALDEQVFDYASFESNNVPFAIITSAAQNIPLKLFTKQALMILDLGTPWEYVAAGVQEPLIETVLSNDYLTSTTLTSPYSLSYTDLNTYIGTSTLQSLTTDVPNEQYFKYIIPGLKTAYNTPGVHTFDPIVKATYLRFGNASAPTSMPGIWLRDYWNDGTLRANMVIRVKYSVGDITFSTERLTWFGSSIDIIDGTVPVPENEMSIVVSSPLVDWTLTAVATGGTAPLTITWWNDAAGTIPATFNSVQVTGTTGYPLTDDTHYAKVTDVHGHTAMSNGLSPQNHDLVAPTLTPSVYTLGETSVTAQGVGGYDLSPYTYAWYNVPTGGNVLPNGTSATYIHNGVEGTYYVEATDALGQKSGRVAFNVVALIDPVIVLNSNLSPAAHDITVIATINNVVAIPAGFTATWTITGAGTLANPTMIHNVGVDVILTAGGAQSMTVRCTLTRTADNATFYSDIILSHTN